MSITTTSTPNCSYSTEILTTHSDGVAPPEEEEEEEEEVANYPNKSAVDERAMDEDILDEEMEDEELEDEVMNEPDDEDDEGSAPLIVADEATLQSNKMVDDSKRPRKFVCRYCHKAFSLMNVLKVHERIHTGEKPYICDICNKAFNQSGSLNRHKNTHTKRISDNRFYSCRLCPRQFLHSTQLQEHEVQVHRLDLMNSHALKTTPSSLESFGKLDELACSNGQPNSTTWSLTSPPTLNTSAKKLSTSQLMQFMENETFSLGNPPSASAANSQHSLMPAMTSANTTTLPSDMKQFVPNLNLIQRLLVNHSVAPKDARVDDTKDELVGLNYAMASPLYTCTLCSAVLGSKNELDLHWGQHFLQQMTQLTNIISTTPSSHPLSLNSTHSSISANVISTPPNLFEPLSNFNFNIANNPIVTLSATTTTATATTTTTVATAVAALPKTPPPPAPPPLPTANVSSALFDAAISQVSDAKPSLDPTAAALAALGHFLFPNPSLIEPNQKMWNETTAALITNLCQLSGPDQALNFALNPSTSAEQPAIKLPTPSYPNATLASADSELAVPSGTMTTGFDVESCSDLDGSGVGSSVTAGVEQSQNKRSRLSNSPQSADRSRKCTLCSKVFNCTSALRIHYRKHSGERPYTCRHCGKAFSQNGTLKRHSQTCKAAFNKSSDLTPIAVDSLMDKSNYPMIMAMMNSMNVLPMGLRPNADALNKKTPTTAQTDLRKPNLSTLEMGDVERSSLDKNVIKKDSESAQLSLTTTNWDKSDYNNTFVKMGFSKESPKSSIPSPLNSATSCSEMSTDDHVQMNRSATKEMFDRFKNFMEMNETGAMMSVENNKLLNHVDSHDQLLNLLRSKSASWILANLTDVQMQSLELNIVINFLNKLNQLKKLHACVQCGIYFLNEAVYQKHVDYTHGSGKANIGLFVCHQCGLQMTNAVDFSKHFHQVCVHVKQTLDVNNSIRANQIMVEERLNDIGKNNNNNNADDNDDDDDDSGENTESNKITATCLSTSSFKHESSEALANNQSIPLHRSLIKEAKDEQMTDGVVKDTTSLDAASVQKSIHPTSQSGLDNMSNSSHLNGHHRNPKVISECC